MEKTVSFFFMPTDEAKAEIRKTIKDEFDRREAEEKQRRGTKCHTINAVAKRLGKNHSTVKKWVKSGLIKSTGSGLITEQAVTDYLRNN